LSLERKSCDCRKYSEAKWALRTIRWENKRIKKEIWSNIKREDIRKTWKRKAIKMSLNDLR